MRDLIFVVVLILLAGFGFFFLSSYMKNSQSIQTTGSNSDLFSGLGEGGWLDIYGTSNQNRGVSSFSAMQDTENANLYIYSINNGQLTFKLPVTYSAQEVIHTEELYKELFLAVTETTRLDIKSGAYDIEEGPKLDTWTQNIPRQIGQNNFVFGYKNGQEVTGDPVYKNAIVYRYTYFKDGVSYFFFFFTTDSSQQNLAEIDYIMSTIKFN